MSKKTKLLDLFTLTKASDDSKLYNTITNIVETLREKSIDDKTIKKIILIGIEQIIDEA